MASEMSKNGMVIFARIGIHNPAALAAGVFLAGIPGASAEILFLIVDWVGELGLIMLS
jgi:hypothetical protein